MNATELELIRQQSDAPTLILMLIMMALFSIGIIFEGLNN